MVWNILTSQGYESFKIFHLVVPYCRGVGLDIGCGPQKCLPYMIGVDAEPQDQAAIKAKAHEIEMFGDGALDFIFSSHLLEHVPPDEVRGVLELWGRKLRVGGYLVLYLPSANLYPKVGEPGANTDHKWNVWPNIIQGVLSTLDSDRWVQVENEERNEGNEYSIFEVWRKSPGEPGVENRCWVRNPGNKKRMLISRFGGIGDILLANEALWSVPKDEYHITFNTQPLGEQVFRHHPQIDEFLIQDKDQVPEDWLGEYFARLSERYDKIIDLNNSVEGLSLMREEQLPYYYPEAARRSLFSGTNYEETVNLIAGGSGKVHAKPSFTASQEEKEWALSAGKKIDGPCVVWAISGSSINKVYPWVNIVSDWLARAGANVIFTGGEGPSARLEEAIVKTIWEDCPKSDVDNVMGRIYPRVGKWTLRQSMAVAVHLADVLVGPETGLMHAAAYYDVPKVMYLSHSTKDNLSKHWRNTITLAPSQEDCPCYPCHRIHERWDTCNISEKTNTALCASSIAPEVIFENIMAVLNIGHDRDK